MFRQDVSEIAAFSMGGKKRFEDAACAICSAVHIVEQVTGKYFSPRLIQIKCLDLKASGIIDEDFYIKNWILLFREFGLTIDIRKEGKDYICKNGEEEILRLRKPGFEHFVPGDGTGHYSFDSLGRRDAQKEYEIHDKWIITVKGEI